MAYECIIGYVFIRIIQVQFTNYHIIININHFNCIQSHSSYCIAQF